MVAEGEPQTILVVLAEADPAGRSLIREALRSVGFANIRDYGDVASLRGDPASAAVEFLIVGADLDGAFDLVRDIRHARFGENPFALVMALVAAERGTELAAAVSAGVDELVTRPLKEAQLMARLRRGWVQRTPFVVTSDFIGPDRRVRERQGSLSRLSVPNVLADNLTGRSVLTFELARQRLAAHGLRLAMLSRLISEGVGAPMLDQLAPILADAAGLAAMLGEPEVELLCRVLTARSRTLSGVSTVEQARFVSDLAEGLVPVLRPGLSAAEHITAAERAASTYRSRPRASLGHATPFGGRPQEPAVDVPAVALMAVPKGIVLFR